MDLLTLVPLPVYISPYFCRRDAKGILAGRGVAVCPDLGLLVISACSKLQVFALPEDIASGTPWELVHVRTLGGEAPMEFQFSHVSGYMTFTDETALLLVTDAVVSGLGSVHVVDVVHGMHVGYVAAPGTICFPRGLAARNSLAAVSCWEGTAPVVRVFQGSGAAWTAVRVIVGGLSWPCGLRFTADGLRVAVADYNHQRVRIFCTQNGSFLRDISVGTDESAMFPLDVEECEVDNGDGGRAGGWVMCHFRGFVVVADRENASNTVARWTNFDVGFNCLTLATLPGVGVVIRHEAGVQFFATPDAVAMAAMSSCKVAWMVAVHRCVSRRHGTGSLLFVK